MQNINYRTELKCQANLLGVYWISLYVKCSFLVKNENIKTNYKLQYKYKGKYKIKINYWKIKWKEISIITTIPIPELKLTLPTVSCSNQYTNLNVTVIWILRIVEQPFHIVNNTVRIYFLLNTYSSLVCVVCMVITITAYSLDRCMCGT